MFGAYSRCAAAPGSRPWATPTDRSTFPASGEPAHVSLPGIHRAASLFKRSLRNAYQQYPKLDRLAYCNEWVFRFNRRHSTARGMLFFRLMELAVQAQPLPYSALICSERPREISPIPAGR